MKEHGESPPILGKSGEVGSLTSNGISDGRGYPASYCIYVAAEDLLDDLADQDSPAKQPSEMIVDLDPKSGEEYRWQLAAMLAGKHSAA